MTTTKRLQSADRERGELLAHDLWNDVFDTLDSELDFSAFIAAEVAAKCEKAFLGGWFQNHAVDCEGGAS